MEINDNLITDYGSMESEREDEEAIHTVRTYKKRWFMLVIFAMYSFCNSFQWIHLNIIGDVIIRYYNESLPESTYEKSNAVDWLSLVFLLIYALFILPASWLLDTKGLRICCVLGAFLNALAACIKCLAVSPDRFALLMFAQIVASFAQLWILGIPARLSAVWFGPSEVATATGIGVLGNQAGIAAGFIIPPEIVHLSEDTGRMGTQLAIMFYGTAAFTTFTFLLILFAFKNHPPKPPSRAQYLAVLAAKNTAYIDSLGRLMRNRGFLILTVAYGLNTGGFYAISTLLNPIVLSYYPGDDESAGKIGLTVVVTGLVGTLLAGFWLDKTGAFRGTTIAFFILSLISMIVFTGTAHLGHIWITYLAAGFLGVFMTGYIPIGFEYAAEITYPESEGTSSSFISLSCQLFGIVLTLVMRACMTQYGSLSVNITITIVLLVASFISVFSSRDYRRRRAAQSDNTDINVEKISD